jgi:hypothetical protein
MASLVVNGPSHTLIGTSDVLAIGVWEEVYATSEGAPQLMEGGYLSSWRQSSGGNYECQ